MEFLVKSSPSWNFYYEGAEKKITIKKEGKEYCFEVPSFIRPMTIYLEAYDSRKHTLKGRVQIHREKGSRSIVFEVDKSRKRMEGTPEGYHGNLRWTLIRPDQDG